MPIFHWASDIHLDHAKPAAVERLHAELREHADTPLLITGDISTARRLASDLTALAEANGAPLWFVLGNHDHYHASVGAVRDTVIGLAERHPQIQWLPPAGVVMLTPDTALIGVDGWADGRHGNPRTTPLVLNDDKLIAEIAAQSDRETKLAVKRALADADATRLTTLLARAVGTAHRVIIATHIPPFVTALPPTGRLSRVEWHPLLVSGATGAVLTEFAARHPTHQFEVLAGHSHSARDVQIAPNLRCRVAGARYGAPRLQSAIV